jgi:hypothetical protein
MSTEEGPAKSLFLLTNKNKFYFFLQCFQALTKKIMVAILGKRGYIAYNS